MERPGEGDQALADPRPWAKHGGRREGADLALLLRAQVAPPRRVAERDDPGGARIRARIGGAVEHDVGIEDEQVLDVHGGIRATLLDDVLAPGLADQLVREA